VVGGSNPSGRAKFFTTAQSRKQAEAQRVALNASDCNSAAAPALFVSLFVAGSPSASSVRKPLKYLYKISPV
jgi:hypothetical protein